MRARDWVIGIVLFHIAVWLIWATFSFLASVGRAQDSTLTSVNNRDGLRNVLIEHPDTWAETANATNGEASAIHAASVGEIHYVTNLVAACASGTSGAFVRLLDGAGVVLQHNSPDGPTPLVLHFNPPFRMTAGNLAEGDIAACGAAVVGRVTLIGYTLTDK